MCHPNINTGDSDSKSIWTPWEVQVFMLGEPGLLQVDGALVTAEGRSLPHLPERLTHWEDRRNPGLA